VHPDASILEAAAPALHLWDVLRRATVEWDAWGGAHPVAMAVAIPEVHRDADAGKLVDQALDVREQACLASRDAAALL
jgi:hypothetical protein